jgi:ABC-type polysaccharide/polyol phosphate export permease
LAINDVVMRAARLFRAHASLVQRVRMPPEVLVVGDALGTMMHHAISFVLVVAFCAWRGHLGAAGIPWIALGLALLFLWIIGASLGASLFGAFLPDIAEMMGLALQVVFYAAPIVYPLALVRSDLVRSLIEMNPLTPLIGVLRTGLVGAEPPTVTAICYLIVGGCFVLWFGAAALDRWRSSIPDVV